MIRTLLALAALSAAPAATVAQAAPDSSPSGFTGVTVLAPPQDPYVIRLDVTGKGKSEIRQMIWRASNEACEHVAEAQWLNSALVRLCVNDAWDGGLKQLSTILDRRKQGLPAQIAIAPTTFSY